MNQDGHCAVCLDEIQHEKREWHVLGEIGMNTHCAEHPAVACVANCNFQASPQAKRTHAQGYENKGKERGIDWKYLHGSSGT